MMGEGHSTREPFQSEREGRGSHLRWDSWLLRFLRGRPACACVGRWGRIFYCTENDMMRADK